MTEQTLELSLLLPREAECASCVTEVGRELGRLGGVHAVEADVRRGLLVLRFDEAEHTSADIEMLARRAGAQAHCADHCPLTVHDHGPLDLRLPLPGEDGAQRRVLHVTGMDCADCAVKLQGALRHEPGVQAADVNFGSATLAIVLDTHRAGVDDVYRAVRRLGYDTVERRTAADGATAAASGPTRRRSFWLSEPRALLTLVAGVFVVGGFAAEAVAPAASPWLFALAMISSGGFVARAAFFSLRARQVDMNVLMTLAAVGAAAIGQWSEAGLVTFLFGLGTVLQAATLERTRRAIRGLLQLAPADCAVIRDGVERRIAAADVRPGDIVALRPGERAAVDGRVIEGTAAVNQAPVTGESLPAAKAPGDQVFAGSIVEGGSLRLRATTSAADNTIAKIVHMVEEAQANRAPSQSIVDRFAARYTPVVVAGAAAVAFVPPLFGAAFDTWFYRGLALLIISCPCALVISTPVSILAALARATRSGVLIKGGVALERAAKVKAVAFDKTGTLTAGRPQVTDVVSLNGATQERLLTIAAAVERLSEHPLARAIVERAATAGLTVDGLAAPTGDCDDDCDCETGADAQDHAAANDCGCCAGHDEDAGAAGRLAANAAHDHHAAVAPAPRVERFRAIPGKGVRAEVDGRLFFVGRPELLGDAGEDEHLRAAVSQLERQGKTAVVIGDEHGGLGIVAIRDPLRPATRSVVEQLRGLGVDSVSMLTGDNPETAMVVAGEAGIHDVHAGLLPVEKVAAVAALRERYGDGVAMVGDGVNDAPALATAGLGIAMGAAGTDAALETADIALMGDDLGQVPQTIRLARHTTRVIWQNIVFSIAVKAVFLVLAPLGLVSLWLAVFADMGTSLLVTGNGLRLLRR
jgi:Zn2+/Cd2+-exporting ATPase